MTSTDARGRAQRRAKTVLRAAWRGARRLIDAALEPSPGWDCDDPLGQLHAAPGEFTRTPGADAVAWAAEGPGGIGPDVAALGVLDGTAPGFTLSYLRASPDCVKLITPEGRVSFVNRNGLRAMELPSFDAVRGRDWWDLWPEESRALLRDAVAAAAGGEAGRFVAFCPTARGAPRWWDVSVSPVAEPDGAVRSLLTISRDVTAPAGFRPRGGGDA